MAELTSATNFPDFTQTFFSDEHAQAPFVGAQNHRAYQKRYRALMFPVTRKWLARS